MKAVILAGGLGTRISEETHLKPKPMIEIGGRPILWHIIKMYSAHGVLIFIASMLTLIDMCDLIKSDKSINTKVSKPKVLGIDIGTQDRGIAKIKTGTQLTSVGNYCVVFDTIFQAMPKEFFFDGPWGPSDNPKTAVWEYRKTHLEFQIDKSIQDKLLITVAPDGYLKRIA